jgi:outer membrane protein TolC
VLAQRRQQADLAAQALDSQIGVAQALGGGWRPEAAPGDAPPADAPGR